MIISGKQLKLALKEVGLTQEIAAKRLGVSRQTLNSWLKNDKLSEDILHKVKRVLYIDLFNVKEHDNESELSQKSNIAQKANLNLNETGVGFKDIGQLNTKLTWPENSTFPINEQSTFITKVPGPGGENDLIPLGNNEFGLTVRVVPVKAYAGYVDNWGDPEYYETLAKRTLTVMGNFRGHYLAFVVKGNSMENWTSEEMAKESIPEGSIVTGRDIQRHHWKNKLHLHRFQDYVIVHKDGIITKRITEHNTEEGYIICHSLNPDYEDRKLMLDDCLQILNIVDVSRPR